jgi:hypothetical protein
VIVALVTLGVLLILFGGLVLLRFPDRPGGEFEFRGVRIQSVGAGLPLIVLGVVTVIIAVLQVDPAAEQGASQPGEPGGTTTTTTTTSTTWAPTDVPTTTTGPGDCLEDYLEREPRVNPAFQKRLPEGETVPVNSMIEFALILVEGTEVTGAVRFRYEPIPPTLTVYDVVDARCQLATSETTETNDAFLVAVTLPDRTYELTVNHEESVVVPKATFRRTG